MTAVAIHLIERERKVRPVNRRGWIFESGDWYGVSDRDADDLVANAGLIFLHEHRNEPSWYGGRILGYHTIMTNGQQRRVFTFEALQECRDVRTDPDPTTWSSIEKKIVYRTHDRE